MDHPCSIVEVTSRSSRRIDRGEKLDSYQRIDSLSGYLIAESDRRLVTYYSRSDGGEWTRTDHATSGRVALRCPPTALTLDDIYEGVEVPPLKVREPEAGDAAWMVFEAAEAE
jgi:Uma2 family endonuclease